MSGPVKLPVMVECAPYKGRLTLRSCVERYRTAQTVSLDGKGMGVGGRARQNGARRYALRNCIGCKVGERRAAEGGDRGTDD